MEELFFLPGFGASSLTEDEDDFNEELDVDVEFDLELELVEDDELDEELELDEESRNLMRRLELVSVFVLSHLTLSGS